jgi:phosphoenolpyruvate carboxylase
MGYATKVAIEEAVYNLVQIGIEEDLWDFQL